MGIVSLGVPLSLFRGPAFGGVGVPSGPRRSGEPNRVWGLWGIGSGGISELTGEDWGAPEITTSGGAGDVLSETGDLRGVMGAPAPGWAERFSPATARGDWFDRPAGEVRDGDDGPGEELVGFVVDVLGLGVGEPDGLFLASFARCRMSCTISAASATRRDNHSKGTVP
jgi:hypothetical protein